MGERGRGLGGGGRGAGGRGEDEGEGFWGGGNTLLYVCNVVLLQTS